MTEWQLQDAKNRFSAVVNAALDGSPQMVHAQGACPPWLYWRWRTTKGFAQAEKSGAPDFIEHLLSIPKGGPEDLFRWSLTEPSRAGMVMYLLDTNVISALRHPDRHPAPTSWLKGQRASDCVHQRRDIWGDRTGNRPTDSPKPGLCPRSGPVV